LHPQNAAVAGICRMFLHTAQGVAMLSGLLNSDIAIDMNIAIMRVFVHVRQILLNRREVPSKNKIWK
jgi:hypothetical protein